MTFCFLAQDDLNRSRSNNYRGSIDKAGSPVTRRPAGCEWDETGAEIYGQWQDYLLDYVEDMYVGGPFCPCFNP